MSRESQGSWSQRRSRGPDVRFFADLEEKNNRNVDVPPHAPPATYQRWSKRRSSSHQQVSKAYDRSADRVNHSHNYPAYRDRSNSRNSDGRARFASDSNNNNKYNGTSRSRSGSIDGIRRSESDHKSFPRSSLFRQRLAPRFHYLRLPCSRRDPEAQPPAIQSEDPVLLVTGS